MSNLIDWMILSRSKYIKNETIRSAIDQYGYNPILIKEKVIEHSKNAGCFDKILFATKDDIEREIEDVERIGAKIITIQDDIYPQTLKNIYNSPIILTAKGNINLLNSESIAIVGSRTPTFHGQQLATEMSSELSKHFVIVSGMASGIDSAAHFGAIEAKKTIAVFGFGINIVYPKENQNLCDLIFENGLCITQFPFQTPPKPANFPIRNQIIATISLCTIVVEAYKTSENGRRSGSLITAEFAYNIGKAVYTVPGFPTKENRFAGNNYLIKSGIAKLVENSDDILNNLKSIKQDFTKIAQEGIKIIKAKDVTQVDIAKTKFNILSILHTIPMSIDEIARHINSEIPVVRATLIELELSEHVQRDFNGNYIKY